MCNVLLMSLLVRLLISINEDLTSSISLSLYFHQDVIPFRFRERKSIFGPRNLWSWRASATTLQADRGTRLQSLVNEFINEVWRSICK